MTAFFLAHPIYILLREKAGDAGLYTATFPIDAGFNLWLDAPNSAAFRAKTADLGCANRGDV